MIVVTFSPVKCTKIVLSGGSADSMNVDSAGALEAFGNAAITHATFFGGTMSVGSGYDLSISGGSGKASSR